MRLTQRALDWRVRAAFFKPFLLAQASSVKMALSCPSRQPVTQAVRCLVITIRHFECKYQS